MNKKFEIDILKLNNKEVNNKPFNYGVFSNDDDKIRNIKLFICLRVLFLADQLHDFTESRAQVSIDPTLAAKNLSPSDLAAINLRKKKELNEIIFKKLKKEVDVDIKIYINTLNVSLNTDYKSVLNNDIKNHRDSILRKIDIFLKSIDDYKPVQNNTAGKQTPIPDYYGIVNQISNALGYVRYPIFDKLTNDGIPYFCGLGYDYLIGAVKLGYNDRYGFPDKDVDTENLKITVDADKSRFAISDIVKVICDLAPLGSDKTVEFVKSLSTEYDAAGKSGTESMIESIIDSRKNIYKTDNVKITPPENYNNSETYILKIADYEIMNFTLTRKQLTISAISELNNLRKNGELNDKTKTDKIKLFPTEYQTFKRNLKNKLILILEIKDNNLPNNRITDVTKYLKIETFPTSISKIENVKKFFEILEKITIIINTSVTKNLPPNSVTVDSLIEECILKKEQMIIILEVRNFFQKYTVYDELDNKSNSVKAIFEKINFKNINNINLSHLFSYKTLGDFSQILSFMVDDSKEEAGIYIPKTVNKFFITFDKICSRIAAIFIHSIIFEFVSKSVVTTLIPSYNEYDDFSQDFSAASILYNISNPVLPSKPIKPNLVIVDKLARASPESGLSILSTVAAKYAPLSTNIVNNTRIDRVSRSRSNLADVLEKLINSGQGGS